MTPQEVIDIIEDVTWDDNGRHYGKINTARDMAIKALEKQMPKKPTYEGDGYVDLGYMHDCGVPIISDEKGNKTYKCQYETIGQYTGLTDKNGKKIFEGDIVKDEQAQMFGKVVYTTAADGFDGMAGFMVDDIDDGLQNYNGFWHLCEIVGNIHDNPELLEVGENA